MVIEKTLLTPDASLKLGADVPSNAADPDAMDKLAQKRALQIAGDGPDPTITGDGAGNHGKQHPAHDGKHAHASHHEVQEEGERKAKGAKPASKSPLSAAIEAASSKVVSGGALFAAFAAVLGVSTQILGSLPLVGGVLAAALAGAVWMAGTEFVKTYNEARADDNSRLNKALSKVKEGLGAAQTQLQQVEAAALHEMDAIKHRAEQAAHLMQPKALSHAIQEAAMPENKTVQAILAAGPRNARAEAIARHSQRATDRQTSEPQADQSATR